MNTTTYNLSSKIPRLAALLALLTAVTATSLAQTAIWTGATGGEWSTAANWDVGIVPGDGTNAVLNSAKTVNYNLPMVAGSFLTLSNFGGIVNVNTNGFVIGGSGNTAVFVTSTTSSRLFVNNGGVLSATNGGVTLTTNGNATLAAGGSLSLARTLVVGAGGNSSSGGGQGFFTNSGGLLSVGGLTVNGKKGNPQTCVALINGGTNSLGAVTVQRCSGSSYPPLGTEGLIISNGLVNMTSLSLADNSYFTMYVAGGTVTNAGTFTLQQTSGGRACRFLQTGGLFVTAEPNVINPNETNLLSGTAAACSVAIMGGTNIASGISFTCTSGTVPGIENFTNAASMYLGSQGIISNGIVTVNGSLNGGGLFGAYADWTNSVALSLPSGTFTFQAADLSGNARNITSDGPLSGGGGLKKTGGGTLTLTATNTYGGDTTISAGTLALSTNLSGSVGTLAGSSAFTINVASNAFFDVSQIGGFVLAGGKTLAGGGTVVGPLAAVGTPGNNAIISPAGSGAQGGLNFANGLAVTNATFAMGLTDDPTGAIKLNDSINITGDFSLGGTNQVTVNPIGSLGIGTYTLITYSGAFNGDLSNLACVAGTLANAPGQINLIVTSNRPAASLTWRGDGSANLWNTAGSSNWFNGANYDRFYTGDTVKFDDSATNFLVGISGVVTPASGSAVVVNATNDYTFEDAGAGNINGTTGLTKTNSGKLTILTTNYYSGVTTIAGGTLSVSNLVTSGGGSPLGNAATDPANLVLNTSTLEYLGATVTWSRGMTLQSGGGTLSVTNAGAALGTSGVITGPGKLTKVGPGQWNVLAVNDYSGGTEVQEGSLRLDRNSGAALGTNTLTLNGDSLGAAFVFGGDTEVLNNTLNVIGANNFVTNNGNNTLNVITGSGTLTLEGASGNVLTFAGDMTGFSGTLAVDTLPNPRFYPSTGSSNAIFALGSGSALLNNRNGGVSILLGALTGGPSTQVQGGSTSTADNRSTTYIIGGKNLDTEFDGVISESTSVRKVAIVKVGTRKLTLTGASTYTGSTTISNGVLALSAGSSGDGSINSSTNITVEAGAFLDVSGRSDGKLPLGAGQTLQGNGTVLGQLDSSGGGTVAPGTSIGTLTVTNTITLGGTTLMEINRNSVPNCDQLVSSLSTVNFGGTLAVTNIGPRLQTNDTFVLFSGTSFPTSFSSVVLPNYYTWDTSNLGVNGSITVTGFLPGPSISGISVSSGTVTLSATGGATNGPVIALMSTNVALPLASWTPVATNSFDGDGNLNGLTIPVDPTATQQFYTLEGE